jgi:hypothetical protein
VQVRTMINDLGPDCCRDHSRLVPESGRRLSLAAGARVELSGTDRQRSSMNGLRSSRWATADGLSRAH